MTDAALVEPLMIACGDGSLFGILHQASASDKHDIGVLIVVGGPQYRVGSHRQFVLMARQFAQAGYSVLRFDFSGMGDSEGVYAGFEGVQNEIRAAVDTFLRTDGKLRGVILWGLCDGASAVLMYAHQDARVAGVVIANPWAHTPRGAAAALVREHYTRRIFERQFWAKLMLGRLDVLRSARELLAVVRARLQTGDTHSGQDYISRMREGCRALSRPMLSIESGRDLTMAEFADMRARDPIWAAAFARGSVERVELPSADHTFSERAALGEMTDRCLEWFARVVRTT